MNRVIFVVGLGVGFVLGARAGRKRYEQIKETTVRVASSEPVRKSVETAQQVLDDATPVLAERAREFAGQAGETSKRLAARLSEGAASVGGSVAGTATNLVDRVTSGADDLSARVTHTTEELRTRSEELRRMSEERIDRVGKRIEEEVERSRDAQVENLVRAGDLREQALAEIVTDDDNMVEPAPGGERS